MARRCGGVNRSGHPARRVRRSTGRAQAGPGTVTSSWVNGTKAQALALARQLLAELSFPPGTSRRT